MHPMTLTFDLIPSLAADALWCQTHCMSSLFDKRPKAHRAAFAMSQYPDVDTSKRKAAIFYCMSDLIVI